VNVARIFIGFDQREAAAYHVCCQSIIEHASIPVAFYPVARNLLNDFDGQQDGSNAFIYSRYLVPYLCDFVGHALFIDGDMVVNSDIAGLWAEIDNHVFDTAVSVVKHDYKTKARRKYVGTPIESNNMDYPRKNWSSVMLWNCAHFANRVLTPEFVAKAGGEHLHRFKWLKDEQIAELPEWWNRLIGEQGPGKASLYHYTLGVPGIKHYADDHASWHWHKALLMALQCAGDDPVDIVTRAQERLGAI
jgi:lipopolysaccharide biosynthesis glycosyltransferase